MNKDVLEFIAELKRFGLDIDYQTASHLYAWVEQKEQNRMNNQLRRDRQCPMCGKWQTL